VTSRTVAVIQARMTSSRLPGKVLSDLAGRPLLQRMLARIGRARCLDGMMVATTVNTSDDAVVQLCDKLRVPVFRGSEIDVLGRMRQAAEQAGAHVVVRLTADCPMIDPQVIDDCVALRQRTGADYASNVDLRTFPDGLDVECFTLQALRKCDSEVMEPVLREHVTPYMRATPPHLPHGEFTRADLTFASDFSHLRWTVDRADDLERVRGFFASLPEPFSWLDALSLATKQPRLLGVVA
jgi:spore coat polysaccharide biosynthesis protein SpsF (cytidylyltransferase family)